MATMGCKRPHRMVHVREVCLSIVPRRLLSAQGDPDCWWAIPSRFPPFTCIRLCQRGPSNTKAFPPRSQARTSEWESRPLDPQRRRVRREHRRTNTCHCTCIFWFGWDHLHSTTRSLRSRDGLRTVSAVHPVPDRSFCGLLSVFHGPSKDVRPLETASHVHRAHVARVDDVFARRWRRITPAYVPKGRGSERTSP